MALTLAIVLDAWISCLVPLLMQTPDPEERAAPWGNTTVNGVKVNQSATLITSADSALANRVKDVLFSGNISNNNALFSKVVAGLYSGNATDPTLGNVFNGDMLSLLGLQLGSSSDLQTALQSERTFTRVSIVLLWWTLYTASSISCCNG